MVETAITPPPDKKKFSNVFAFLILLGITIGFFFFYHYKNKNIASQKGYALEKVAVQRGNEARSWVQEQQKLLTELKKNPLIIDTILGQKKDTIQSFLGNDERFKFFKNIYFISPDEKLLFAMENPKTDFLTTSLKQSLERVTMCLSDDISSFSYNSETHFPELFISTPFFEKDKLVGILSVSLSYTPLYRIFLDAAGLGKSGETILLESEEKNSAVVIAPTRFHPDAAFSQQYYLPDFPMEVAEALLGKTGSGISEKEENREVNAWHYISQLNWGIVVKMAYAEAISSIWYWKYALILFSIGTVSYAFFLIFFRRRELIPIYDWCKYRRGTLLLFSLIVVAGLFVTTWMGFVSVKKEFSKKYEIEILERTNKISDYLNFNLEKISQIGESIAIDLQRGSLKKEDLKTRLNRDVNENPLLYGVIIAYNPFKYEKGRKVFALEAVRDREKQLNIHQIDEAFGDYTASKNNWFAKAQGLKGGWLSLYKDPMTMQNVAAYVATFTENNDENVSGYVISLFELKQLSQFLESFEKTESSYSIVTTKKGMILYSPEYKEIGIQTTIFDLAQEMGSSEFLQIAKEMLANRSGWGKFTNTISDRNFRIYYEEIPATGWEIATVSSEAGLHLPPIELRQHLFKLVTISLLFIWLLSFFPGYFIKTKEKRHTYHIFTTTVFLLGGIFALWKITLDTTSIDISRRGKVIVDNIDLEHYLLDKKRIALTGRGQSPITVPTGIFLNSITLGSKDEVSVSGYVWQRYDDIKHKDLTKKIVFPESLENLSIEEVFHKKENGEEIIGWNVILRLPQTFNYKQFPVDVNDIHLVMQHPDRDKNVVLIPDINSYSEIRPEALPGIRKGIELEGYVINGTFFTMVDKNVSVSFGLGGAIEAINNNLLIYNIVIERNLIGAFMAYLLPLFVILTVLYGTFVVAAKSENKSDIRSKLVPIITVYGALIFGLIIIHTSLRQRYQTGNILYIEYFYFISYVILILCMSLTIWMGVSYKKESKMDKIFILFTKMFWPLQFLLWYGITFWVFKG